MSSYAEILRHSRLMALPPSIKSSGPHCLHPTSPTIQTSRASQAVGDWGLKRNLPRLRTESIAISDIDTQEHQTPFKSSSKFTKTLKRWQEMGIPLRSQRNSDLFMEKTSAGAAQPETITKNLHINSASRRDIDRLLQKANHSRRSFLATRERQSKVFTNQVATELRRAGKEYLGFTSGNRRINKTQPSAGLAYHPMGALSIINTPNGPQERTLTGRVLHDGKSVTLVGLGGILAKVQDRHDNFNRTRSHGRSATMQVYTPEVEVQHDGQLSISVEDVRPNLYDKNKAAGLSPYMKEFDRNVAFDSEFEGFDDDEMEFGEDSFLGRNAKASPGISKLGALLRNSPLGKKEQGE